MPPLIESLSGCEYHASIKSGNLQLLAGVLRRPNASEAELSAEFSSKLQLALSQSNCMLLTIDNATYALYQEASLSLSIFDSHGKDAAGNISDISHCVNLINFMV